jgi:pimeloyl-ACP methyl ester carboxylesterase
MTNLLRSLIIASLSATAACSHVPLNIQATAQGSALHAEVLDGRSYRLQALVPRSGHYERLRVYIEGDGRAWKTSRVVSDDPTPGQSLVLDMAVNDDVPAIYLARPCQFISSPGCSKQVWTSGRYSQTVIDVYLAVLDTLKSKYGVSDFELVGHSGGATVALLVAAQRRDVGMVQTLAGNVDHAAWTRSRNLLPLQDSLNPTLYAQQLRAVPQRHYVGRNDRIIPASVLDSYMSQIKPVCSQTVIVDGDHHSGYQAEWSALKDQSLDCSR